MSMFFLIIDKLQKLFLNVDLTSITVNQKEPASFGKR